MTKEEELNAAIWREGLKLLAREANEHGLGIPMAVELLDRLLVDTGEIQDPSIIATILTEEGLTKGQAAYVADLYVIVDMIRTGGEPIEVYCWEDDVMERIRERIATVLPA